MSWHKLKDDTLVTEVSSLDKQLWRCPICASPIVVGVKTVKNTEGEITHWECVHTCGTRLKIFND